MALPQPEVAVPPLQAPLPSSRLATRLLFLVAGFAYACWAPLVPLTRQRLGIDEHVLGLLLLCMGAGSILAMVATGIATARYGGKPVLAVSGLGVAGALALLPQAGTAGVMAAVLLGFGAVLGAMNVAMNVQAVEVERAHGRPLMSGFHAFFSIGGFAGSALMTVLLTSGWTAALSVRCCAALIVAAMAVALPRLPGSARSRGGPLFALPRGLVLVVAVLVTVTFLTEGALLDWGALLITDAKLVAVSQGGAGYMMFSVAMTAGRLGGDRVTARLGDRNVLSWGGVIALAGFVALLTAETASTAFGGFVLIGLGCSNIVPVLFRLGAAQKTMPSGLAIAAITTTGYAGILAGPAAIGFAARMIGLPGTFWVLAALLGLVPLGAHLVPARPQA